MTAFQNENLSSIFKWVSDHLPELHQDLQSAAPAAKLTELEDKIGVQFDDTFKDLYSVHNGQKMLITTGLFYGLEFLSLEKVSSQWELWASVIQDDAAEGWNLGEFAKSHEVGKIKEQYASKKWVPFAFDWGGNHLGLDFDPGPNGRLGQVINFGRDEDVKYVVADSFEAFIDWFATQLENGNFKLEKHGESDTEFNTLTPQSGHFLDAVREIFDGTP